MSDSKPKVVVPGQSGGAAMTKEEKQRRALATVQGILQKIHQADTIRNGDPNFVYIWVFDHPQRIDYYQMLGAEIVGAGEAVRDPADTSFKRNDGQHHRGDTVLMRLPRETAEALNVWSETMSKERITGAKQKISDELGLETFTPSRT